MLALSTALAAGANALVFATDVGQQALVDQWERTALAFGRPVDDARYTDLRALSMYGPWYGIATAAIYGPGLTSVAAALLFTAFRTPHGRRRFTEVLAVTVHAGVILALRQIVAAPATYLRETTSSATSLGVWFPSLNDTSPLARLLGMLDVFVLWWLVVLAIGLGVLYGRPSSRFAIRLLGIYAALALLLALAMAALGGTAA